MPHANALATWGSRSGLNPGGWPHKPPEEDVHPDDPLGLDLGAADQPKGGGCGEPREGIVRGLGNCPGGRGLSLIHI
eukprot:4333000-Alexandrium_andersonii.AAC.1